MNFREANTVNKSLKTRVRSDIANILTSTVALGLNIVQHICWQLGTKDIELGAAK